MQSITLTGAHIRVYINGVIFSAAQGINYTLDNGGEELYGVDSIYPQEIIPKRSTVNGSINFLKLKQDGGLQAKGIRGLAKDIMKHPYISIRIQDRQTGEDILLVPKAMVTSETFSAQIKSSVKLTLNFRGIIPLQPLDRV